MNSAEGLTDGGAQAMEEIYLETAWAEDVQSKQ